MSVHCVSMDARENEDIRSKNWKYN